MHIYNLSFCGLSMGWISLVESSCVFQLAISFHDFTTVCLVAGMRDLKSLHSSYSTLNIGMKRSLLKSELNIEEPFLICEGFA